MNFHTLALCILEIIKPGAYWMLHPWLKKVENGFENALSRKATGSLSEFLMQGEMRARVHLEKLWTHEEKIHSQHGKLPVHSCLHLQEGCREDRWVSYHPLPYAESSREETTPRLHPQGFNSACKWSQKGLAASHIFLAFFLVLVHMNLKGGLKGLREEVL